jgi:hypothetical protein
MEINQVVQFELLGLCDCCGELSGPGLKRHKACNRAWEMWLRTDNHDEWRNMPTRQEQ